MKKKIYDFSVDKVKTKLVTVFKKYRREATVADLIAETGLPKYQVEQSVKHVMNEYSGHLKVTESGELVYYFPHGMRNRIKGIGPALKNFWKSFLKVSGKVLSFLFKIWIMVMLVGYFILFLVILIAAIVASIALSASRRSDSRSRSGGGGIFSMYLVLRLIEAFLRVFFFVSLTKKSKKQRRPFYKSVFAYVFGDEDPNSGWEEHEKKQVIGYIRRNRGAILIDELMVLTGKDYDEAQILINQYMLEFEGEPQVTDDGTIVFFFPELLRSQASAFEGTAVDIARPEKKKIIPFNTNEGKSNGWISFFNVFNLCFGGYFSFWAIIGGRPAMEGFGILYGGVHYFLLRFLGLQDPQFLILIVLGIIPVSFAFLFFLVPVLRILWLKGQNEKIKRENLQKKLYSSVLQNPARVDEESIAYAGADETPKNARQFIQKQVKRYAAIKQADVEAEEGERFVYNFTELNRQKQDIAAYRNKIDLKQYEVGDIVFDSGE
jgi:hypothetical protein